MSAFVNIAIGLALAQNLRLLWLAHMDREPIGALVCHMIAVVICLIASGVQLAA